MTARLSMESGQGPPRVFDLDPDAPNTLGRSRENTIPLHDEHASRKHARIYREDDRWLIENISALNGTFLNGARITGPTPLGHGQQIAIGELRLFFTLGQGRWETPLREAIRNVSGSLAAPDPTAVSVDPSHTALLGDELTAMYDFASAANGASDAHALVRQALTTVIARTGATFAGFLSLDQEGPLPKLVLPELARMDVRLSRQLTEKAQKDGRPVWLGSTGCDVAESDSLLPFNDAMCLPLVAGGSPLGALHLYKTGESFHGRHLQFCELVAGFLANSLSRLRVYRAMEAENSRLRARASVSESLIGDSEAMSQLRRLIARFGPIPFPVLILGETGSGKELVAQGLHHQSKRRDGPLVVLNCAAIAPSLIEAELFGHVKGSFTGATGHREGVFQQADEGTLFLDEIGEMSDDCQAKLLRIIEGKPFRQVGGNVDICADVRIIAATHRDLMRLVDEGKFRKDLYFRLASGHIAVPSLREHPEDIPALADYFLDKDSAVSGKRMHLTDAAMLRLKEFSWPGNVRQLRAVLQSAVAMSDVDPIDADSLVLSPPQAHADLPHSLKLADVEAWAIRKALGQSGSALKAARMLGIARDTLYLKIKKYKIRKGNGKARKSRDQPG